MVFIEKILLMTITQHFKKRVDPTFFMPGRPFSSRLTAQFGIPIITRHFRYCWINLLIFIKTIKHRLWWLKDSASSGSVDWDSLVIGESYTHVVRFYQFQTGAQWVKVITSCLVHILVLIKHVHCVTTYIASFLMHINTSLLRHAMKNLLYRPQVMRVWIFYIYIYIYIYIYNRFMHALLEDIYIYIYIYTYIYIYIYIYIYKHSYTHYLRPQAAVLPQ